MLSVQLVYINIRGLKSKENHEKREVSIFVHILCHNTFQISSVFVIDIKTPKN